MSSSVVKALLLIAALAAFLLASCQADRGPGRTGTDATSTQTGADATSTPTRAVEPPTPKPTPTVPGVSLGTEEGSDMPGNRIAYIGPDGNVYTIRPDGTGSLRLTDTDIRVGPSGNIMAQSSQARVLYAWPAWSPDGTKLAVSRIVLEGSSVSSTLLTIDSTTGSTVNVYDNLPEAGFVAAGAPHYIYWSPDGRFLTFLASIGGSLALLVSEVAEDAPPVSLIEGAPLYYSWAPDGGSMLIHRGNDLLLSTSTQAGLDPPLYLGDVGITFYAPSLSPDGRTLAYASGVDFEGGLFTAAAEGAGGAGQGLAVTGARRLLSISPFAALRWSPTRDEVAVVDRAEGRSPLFDRLSLVSEDGSEHRVLVDESLMAFFWSPNGDRIAYVVYNQSTETFSWRYVERTGGDPVELVEFLPSLDFETIIRFFDQYSYSNSIWSPDSSQLVFSGTLGPSAPRRNGSAPETDKVYVIDVKEGAAPREIATSRYAVWSWN